jgi:hypothetical protein
VSAIWDGDTGHVTITATKNGAPVNLTGAECTVIARRTDGGAAITLAEVPAASDRGAGVVVADASPLEVGTYVAVVRAVANGITATYPSADQPDQLLTVKADLDATP